MECGKDDEKSFPKPNCENFDLSLPSLVLFTLMKLPVEIPCGGTPSGHWSVAKKKLRPSTQQLTKTWILPKVLWVNLERFITQGRLEATRWPAWHPGHSLWASEPEEPVSGRSIADAQKLWDKYCCPQKMGMVEVGGRSMRIEMDQLCYIHLWICQNKPCYYA